MTLQLQPIRFAEACAFIALHHRHHEPPQGWLFGIGLNDGERVVGVVTVGRPVARMLDDGWTAEVTRCCVQEGVPHGCSKLYAAAWRACRAMGYRRLITYTLGTEKGVSLFGAGWKCVGEIKGHSWNMPGRPRVDKAPICNKTLWEMTAAS